MTKPTTDAGRRYSEQPPGSLDEWNVAILAIENEARANVTSHVTFPTPPSLDVERLAVVTHKRRDHPLGGACDYCRREAAWIAADPRRAQERAALTFIDALKAAYPC